MSEYQIPESFRNLIESEIVRPRRDGLTTKLIFLAKSMNYSFIGDKHTEQDCKKAGVNYVKPFTNIRGYHGGYIWDHYSVHRVCVVMGSTFDALNDAYDKIQTDLNVERALLVSARYKIELLESEIKELKAKKKNRKKAKKP